MEKTVGVVIGRFQIDELHEGHKYLIKSAMEKHPQVIIMVGVNPISRTRRNPLSFQERWSVLQTYLSSASVAHKADVIIVPVYDMDSNQEWSRQVDNIIRMMLPGFKATIYCSNDELPKAYSGQHSITELEPWFINANNPISATCRRKEISLTSDDDVYFRRGIINAIENQLSYVKPAVDIVVVDGNRPTMFLVGRKYGESKWRFPGGMVDIADMDYEDAARRELYEETKIVAGTLIYLGSFNVPDWRMRDKTTAVFSTLFLTEYNSTIESASDDLVALKWVIATELLNVISDGHLAMANTALAYVGKVR